MGQSLFYSKPAAFLKTLQDGASGLDGASRQNFSFNSFPSWFDGPMVFVSDEERRSGGITEPTAVN